MPMDRFAPLVRTSRTPRPKVEQVEINEQKSLFDLWRLPWYVSSLMEPFGSLSCETCRRLSTNDQRLELLVEIGYDKGSTSLISTTDLKRSYRKTVSLLPKTLTFGQLKMYNSLQGRRCKKDSLNTYFLVTQCPNCAKTRQNLQKN